MMDVSGLSDNAQGGQVSNWTPPPYNGALLDEDAK